LQRFFAWDLRMKGRRAEGIGLAAVRL
jgi:hypothetical protein